MIVVRLDRTRAIPPRDEGHAPPRSARGCEPAGAPPRPGSGHRASRGHRRAPLRESRAMQRPPGASTLSEDDRRVLAVWAADCAERVLRLFESQAPGDTRPRDAIDGLRAFARGELRIGVVRALSARAHAAAREAREPAAVAAARGSGPGGGDGAHGGPRARRLRLRGEGRRPGRAPRCGGCRSGDRVAVEPRLARRSGRPAATAAADRHQSRSRGADRPLAHGFDGGVTARDGAGRLNPVRAGQPSRVGGPVPVARPPGGGLGLRPQPPERRPPGRPWRPATGSRRPAVDSLPGRPRKTSTMKSASTARTASEVGEGIAGEHGDDVVVGAAPVGLLHEADDFGVHQVPGPQRAAGDDEAVHRVAVGGQGPRDEPVRVGEGRPDPLHLGHHEALLVVVVLEVRPGHVLDEHPDRRHGRTLTGLRTDAAAGR